MKSDKSSGAARYLEKISRRLFDTQGEQRDFESAVTDGIQGLDSLIRIKEPNVDYPFENYVDPLKIPHIFLTPKHSNPGRHPLHREGYYYCMDYSSSIAVSVVNAIPRNPKLIFDMCASPGGKGIYAWKSLQPQKIVFNEVIGKRLGALRSNIERCGITNATVTCVDSKYLKDQYHEGCDLLIVDAPCSGQSLVAKGEDVLGCFHPMTIKKNAGRQKRIIANSAKMVTLGGYLAYMTCTYSIEENEDVIRWLLKKFPEFTPIEVASLSELRSKYSDFPSYRMFPHRGQGAGGFCALLRRSR